MSESNYPRAKVFWAFFLCPLVPGFVGGIIKTLMTIAHLVSNPRLLGEVGGAQLMLMPFVAPIAVELLFLVPFFCFALGIALMKITHSTASVKRIAVVGSCLATSWLFLVFAVVLQDRTLLSNYVIELLVMFVASMVTCGVTARLCLPEPSEVESDVARRR